MPKDENQDMANGSGPSARVVTPDGVWLQGFIDEADRLEVEAQHARFDEVIKELEAEGVDGTEEYEKLLAKAATWSSAPS